MDATARAAVNMPNSATNPSPARAVRGGEAKTPEDEIHDEEALDGYTPGDRTGGQRRTLYAPRPIPPSRSHTSTAASTSLTTHGVSQRMFLDPADTPSQQLTRPAFQTPPSSSTYALQTPPSSSTYALQTPSPLSLSTTTSLFINQAISVLLSTVPLTFVVIRAIAAETAGAISEWIRPIESKRFSWDDDQYWRKEGKMVSKDPRDYARQVGMDIEHQTVETEDGYHLR